MLRSARVVAVLVAAALCGPAAAAGPARTPPDTWSTAGYQQLRFGMGPGDVEDALKKGEGPLYLDKELELATPMPGIALGAPTGSRVNVAGRGTTAVVFAFWQNQLYLVAIVFTGGDKDPGTPEWFKEVSRLLSEKYGASESCGKEECSWTKGDLNVRLGISLEAKDKTGGLEYKSIPLSAKVDKAIEDFKKDPKVNAKDL